MEVVSVFMVQENSFSILANLTYCQQIAALVKKKLLNKTRNNHKGHRKLGDGWCETICDEVSENLSLKCSFDFQLIILAGRKNSNCFSGIDFDLVYQEYQHHVAKISDV